jgi:iron complex transport system substrate-binding protein
MYKLKTALVHCSILSLWCLVLSCSTGGIDSTKHTEHDSSYKFIPNRHAQGFHIRKTADLTTLSVFNPWQGARDIKKDVFLIAREAPAPEGIDPLDLIRVPVESIVCLSTTHIGYVSRLGEAGKITGIAGARYISDETVRKGLENGFIKDLGYDQNLDYESLVKLRPDLVMVYGVGPETTAYALRIRELGIPILFIAEYLESTALGKAEWIRLVGELFAQSELADSLFEEMEKEYLSLKKLAVQRDSRPSVLINLPWKGTWHMAGGQSFFAGLIEDAGGHYLWKENAQRESFPVSMEVVFQKALHADVWLNPGTANSLNDILRDEPRVKALKPILTKNVFNNNARLTDLGGNDYWESGIVNPHLILRDLIQMFHPGLLPETQLVYFKKLE